MSELVSPCFTIFRIRSSAWAKWTMIGLVLMVAFAGRAFGQEGRKVPISFLPPPLENATYSLGIYETKSGKLVRRLQEIAPESAFTVGLNGLITNWDGKDDGGKSVSPGRYAARGYAVGALKVEGVGILGNDWASDDENSRIRRVAAIALVPEDEGLAVVALARRDEWEVLRYAGTDGRMIWHTRVGVGFAGVPDLLLSRWTLEVKDGSVLATVLGRETRCDLADGKVLEFQSPPTERATTKMSVGKDNTQWKIEEGGVLQLSPTGEALRRLLPKAGEPIPEQVVASTKSERIYLLENSNDWQRVRGLSWAETKEEDGKPVSTWQTFFERNIRAPDPALVLDHPASTIEISLVENQLVPGKSQKMKLTAGFDDKGSYLTSTDGLHLRQISQKADLRAVKLAKAKTASSLTFFQSDGAAWDEFSIEGAKNMMEFDAGEIEMTAEGEKVHSAKAAEPPDL